MKKIIIGLVALTSVSSFSMDTTCKIVDKNISDDSRVFKLKSDGPSTLSIDQSLIEGLDELNLIALSQSVETRIGSKVKKYSELERFAVSFENRNTTLDKEVRLKINEDKTFELFIESWPEGKELAVYSGKCKNKVSKAEAKEMVDAINKSNAEIGL